MHIMMESLSSNEKCHDLIGVASNTVELSSLKLKRDSLMGHQLQPKAALGSTEACWVPPSPVAEANSASASWDSLFDFDCSQGVSSANWSQASLSLSSTCAGAVANPKKNPFSPSIEYQADKKHMSELEVTGRINVEDGESIGGLVNGRIERLEILLAVTVVGKSVGGDRERHEDSGELRRRYEESDEHHSRFPRAVGVTVTRWSRLVV
nr:hypothetical protein Iba_chr13dCG1190 [Ipomoea batatas]